MLLRVGMKKMGKGYMPIFCCISGCKVYTFTLGYEPNIPFFIDCYGEVNGGISSVSSHFPCTM